MSHGHALYGFECENTDKKFKRFEARLNNWCCPFCGKDVEALCKED